MIEEIISTYPSEAAFCREIGIKQQFYSQIKKGKRPWPPRIALSVERATKGAVTRYDLRPDIFGREPESRS